MVPEDLLRLGESALPLPLFLRRVSEGSGDMSLLVLVREVRAARFVISTVSGLAVLNIVSLFRFLHVPPLALLGGL
jgi:hypothetical protein